MAVSEPQFKVISKSESYEIREYPPVLVAETLIQTEFEDAGNKAFKILADYIYGNNISKTKIDMTAPVSQQKPSEKIEMTAPVSQIQDAQGQLVQFMMPEQYTLETIPTPNDSRVRIRQIPARQVAVYRYSGSWSESRFKSKLAEFNAHLKKNNIITVGEPIFARFNSPLLLWFLRRNEIWLELQLDPNSIK